MRDQDIIKATRDFIRAELHTDANETVFLERELTQLRSKIMYVEYPALKGRSMAPLASDIAPSATTYSYKVLDRLGRARISADGSGDVPRIDTFAKEVTGKVRMITASYGWTKNEMREAARLGVPLSQVKGNSASEACETSVDEMIAFGDLAESTGQDNVTTTGILNNADIAAQGIIDPAHDSWLSATASDILTDLNGFASVIVTQSNQTYIPDTLVLSPYQYDVIAKTPYSSTIPDTILSVFLKNNPYIKNVEQWYRCNAQGVGGKDRGIVYQKSPNVLEAVIPQQFEQEPPQAEKLEVVIYCSERCGGVKVHRPVACRYIDFTR